MIGIFQPSSLSRKQRGMINVPPPKTLLTGTWNINGFRSKGFGNKFEQQYVQNIIKKYDIIGFTETHTSNDISLSLPGFSVPFTKNRPKIGSHKKLSGGIAVFVKDYLIDSKSICQVQTNNQNVIWLKLKEEKFKGTLPNFDPLDEKSIVRTIDFWTNFSTRRSVYKIKNAQLDD